VAEVWEEPQTSEIWLDIQGRDNLAMAIGAGGANIRAANRLVNRRIMAVLSPEPAEGMDLRRKSQDLTGIVAAIVRNNVPEVATNKIEIVGVGYLPNEACKVGVRATGTHPNPVGACLGKNGDHLPAIRAALGGCPLSFFVWTDDPRQLVINALYPLEEDDIISFQENPDGSLSLVVSDDRVGAVVGKSGRQLRAAELVLNRTVYVQPPAQES
jgi:transcription antitermination factor NusA-like protein